MSGYNLSHLKQLEAKGIHNAEVRGSSPPITTI